jgi:osmotically-inducible protein OsmY
MRQYPTSLLVVAGTLATTAAVYSLPQRNPDLEIAVVNRLFERGFGRTNRILILNAEEQVAETSGDYEHRWAQSAKDRRLQQQIARQLQEDIPGGRDLYVLVQNKQAFLFGLVRNQQQRRLAEEISQAMTGIERADNRIIVAERGWTPQEDPRIEDAIRDGLSRSPFVDSDVIEVDVGQGVVVLNGTVDSFSKLLVAVERAYRGGARAVRSQLQVAQSSDHPQTDREERASLSDRSGLP